MTRRVHQDSREFIVAPISIIVPGVLNGSKGALYYPGDEVAHNPSKWNKVPMVLYHPTASDGSHISAKAPGVVDRTGLGFIDHSVFNGKLVVEGWFDIAKTRELHPDTLRRLEAGEKIEVSTGLFTENEEAPPGSHFNGMPYQYVARNYIPDHLAILPDQVGACSLNDGCGVNNQEKPMSVYEQTKAAIEATIAANATSASAMPPKAPPAPTPPAVPAPAGATPPASQAPTPQAPKAPQSAQPQKPSKGKAPAKAVGADSAAGKAAVEKYVDRQRQPQPAPPAEANTVANFFKKLFGKKLPTVNWQDAAKDAMSAAKDADTGSKGADHSKAMALSKFANKMSKAATAPGAGANPDEHRDAQIQHAAAQSSHRNAAMAHQDAGNYQVAAAHDKAADQHGKRERYHDSVCGLKTNRRASGKLDTNQETKTMAKKNLEEVINLTREQKVAKLTANCKCDKEKAAIPHLSDNTLDHLLKANAKFVKDNEDDDDDDEDDDDDDDDDDSMIENDEMPTGNTAMTTEQFLAACPAEIRETIVNARNVEIEARQDIAKKLKGILANMAKGPRKTLILNKLKTNPNLAQLKELMTLVGDVPVQNNGGWQPLPPLFQGAAGGADLPLTNASGGLPELTDDDNLIPIVMNFKEESKRQQA